MLGIDPAANVAAAAEARGVPTLVEFFGVELAKRLVAEGTRADLVVGNNVLAQVPDLNDFVARRRDRCSRPDGTATFEFPHLARLLEGLQYDTIYHEHFSYFSLDVDLGDLRRARARRRRRRGAAEPRRLAPRLRRARVRGTRAVAPRVAELLAREERRGPPRAGPVCAVRRRRRGVEARAARPADRAPARRQARSSATARPARATRCSTTAASAPTSSTTPSTAIPTSTAGSRRERTSRSTRPSGSPRRGRTRS